MFNFIAIPDLNLGDVKLTSTKKNNDNNFNFNVC